VAFTLARTATVRHTRLRELVNDGKVLSSIGRIKPTIRSLRRRGLSQVIEFLPNGSVREAFI